MEGSVCSDIPRLGLGTWKSKDGEVYGAVREALHAGYKHIDCAPAYGNEKGVGAALAEMTSSGKVSRESLWITSKLWNNAHEFSQVEFALKKTLTDLQLDYLDLYLIHWPVVFRPDIIRPTRGSDFLSLDQVPLSETWAALEQCVQKGLVKHIGVCNFSRKQLGRLLGFATLPPAMNQIELHPFLQQRKMLAFCKVNNITITAYSPLGSPDRPMKLKKTDEPQLLTHPCIIDIADRLSATPAQVLIAWGLKRKTVVIPKSVHPQRIRENFAAAQLELTSEDMERILSLDKGYRYVDGSFWEIPGSGYSAAEIWEE